MVNQADSIVDMDKQAGEQQGLQGVLAERGREVRANPQRRARYDIPSSVLAPKAGDVDNPFCDQLKERAHFDVRTPKSCQDVVLPVKVSLKEVYEGATKTVTTLVRVPAAQGADVTTLEASFTVDVERGAQPGTRYLFHGAGHQDPGRLPGGVELVLVELPHPRFTREGEHLDDLVLEESVNLREALLGTTIEVRTLDERVIRVAITDIVTPGYERRLHGEGLHIGDDLPGDLVLRLDVVFPIFLPRRSKQLLEEALRVVENKAEPHQDADNAVLEAERLEAVHGDC